MCSSLNDANIEQLQRLSRANETLATQLAASELSAKVSAAAACKDKAHQKEITKQLAAALTDAAAAVNESLPDGLTVAHDENERLQIALKMNEGLTDCFAAKIELLQPPAATAAINSRHSRQSE